MFDESAFDNIETYITTEEVTDDNKLIGLTNLKNDKREVLGKLISLVAKIKGRDGTIYTVTLGGVANPNIWEEYADSIINNPKAIKEDKEWADKVKNEIIPKYEAVLKQLISSKEEVPVDVNFSKMTTLINKDGDGNPNPEIRLLDLDPNSDRTPFDNKTKHAVRSRVYIPRDKNCTWLPQSLIGRPIIFVSSNVFLKPDQLASLYETQKTSGKDYGIRIIPLSNKGISFKSLYRSKWKSVYTTTGSVNTMPFELLPQGIRMYISMWNFRANLQKFVTVYNEWKNGANSENRKLSDDEVLDLLKLDQDEYNRVKGSKKYIDEKTYRNGVNKDVKSKLEILWKFNDSLSESVREFRLGYDINNGVRIRTLTNISNNNPFYGEKLKKSKKSIQGIYIMPDLAQKYLDTLNTLFDNVINQLIPTNRDSSFYIDKEETLNDKWFNEKVEDHTSMSISGFDENGNLTNSTIDFQNESTLKMIPLTMVLISKYLETRQYDPDRFDTMYQEYIDADKPRYHIFVNKDGNKISLNYISIATTLGLQQTTTKDNYTSGLGLKPYDEKEGVGTVDRRYDNLMSLMFHGLVETTEDNNFDNPSDLRATDADFKFGFFSDPVAFKGGQGVFADVATNESLFSTNLLPGFPIITFKLKNNKTTTQPEEKPDIPPVTTNQLNTLKTNIVNELSNFGIAVDPDILEDIDSEKDLVDYVNSILNPKFAQGNTTNEINSIKKASEIYKYFTKKLGTEVHKLIDYIEIRDGNIVLIPISLQELPIDDTWTQIWSETEDNCIILTSPDNKIYKVKFDEDSGDINVELLNKVEIKSEDNSKELNFGNIYDTINSYIDELLSSYESEFSDDIESIRKTLDKQIKSEYENNPNSKTNVPSDNDLKDRLNVIIDEIKECIYERKDTKNWDNKLNELTNKIDLIITEKRLRDGCDI